MSLDEVFSFVSPRVKQAALQAAAQLEHVGVRFALAGGLAVGAHGYVRATADVVFLVGDEAFDKIGLLVTFKPGVPIEVGGIRIEYLSPTSLGAHMEEALTSAPRSHELPVVPVEALIEMKLVARRRKDLLDVVELLRAGADARRTRAWLEQNAPHHLQTFEELYREALE